MVENLRIDYFAHRSEVPLFPKILRNSLMVYNMPNKAITALFLLAVCGIFLYTLLKACTAPNTARFRSLCTTHVLLSLLGTLILAIGLAKQTLLFWTERPYSVSAALVNLGISLSGAVLALL